MAVHFNLPLHPLSPRPLRQLRRQLRRQNAPRCSNCALSTPPCFIRTAAYGWIKSQKPTWPTVIPLSSSQVPNYSIKSAPSLGWRLTSRE